MRPPTVGYGDPATWGWMRPLEEDTTETWYEAAARITDEAKRHLDKAATAAFTRDEPAYRLAMINAIDAVEAFWLPTDEDDSP